VLPLPPLLPPSLRSRDDDGDGCFEEEANGVEGSTDDDVDANVVRVGCFLFSDDRRKGGDGTQLTEEKERPDMDTVPASEVAGHRSKEFNDDDGKARI
jgi:hypothetical protein